jgi:hypothetical protein
MAGFFNLWSKTAASNSNSDSTINWAEGQLPSTVNGSARAEMAALASFRDDINGSLTTAGSSNAYTITTNIAFTALATGLMIAFKANHTNTGAPTLAANGLTAKALRTQDDAALLPGQIVNNGQYFAKYDAAANAAAGAWLVQNPTPKSPVLLTSGSVSSAATLDIVLTSYTGYRGLTFYLGGFIPATDAVALYARFSTDGGSNYDATGYNYAAEQIIDDSATAQPYASGSANQIQLFVNATNGGTGGYSGEVLLLKQTSTTLWSRITYRGYGVDDSARARFVTGGGAREAQQDTDAIRFLFSSGNIAAGDYAVYGLP